MISIEAIRDVATALGYKIDLMNVQCKCFYFGGQDENLNNNFIYIGYWSYSKQTPFKKIQLYFQNVLVVEVCSNDSVTDQFFAVADESQLISESGEGLNFIGLILPKK